MIVKVELVEPGHIRLQNESKSIVVDITRRSEVESVLRMIGNVPRAYCKARYEKASKAVHLLRTVKPQPW